METRGILVAAGAAALVLLGAGALLGAHPGERNLEYFPDMAHSRALESLDLTAHLPGGRVQLELPEGSVPRGAERFPYGTGPEEAARAGRELRDPLGEAGADPARGARLFAIHCTPCHDARGDGRGPVVERGMLPPPSLHGVRALGMADGEMFHVLTRGQGGMASYASQLTPRDRWLVVRHVRALQGGEETR